MFDTWLEEEDIIRIYNVCNTDGINVTANELDEFLRLVNHAIMIKAGGKEYNSAIIQ